MQSQDDRAEELIIILIVVLPCAISILIGGFMLAMECVRWLGTAVWDPYTLYDAFGAHIPSTKLLGLNKILDWCLSRSVVLWLLILGPVLWLGGWLLIIKWARAYARED